MLFGNGSWVLLSHEGEEVERHSPPTTKGNLLWADTVEIPGEEGFFLLECLRVDNQIAVVTFHIGKENVVARPSVTLQPPSPSSKPKSWSLDRTSLKLSVLCKDSSDK